MRFGVIFVVLGWSAIAHAQLVSPVLYLNRCRGGCRVEGATIDDARANKSTIPCAGGGSCSGGACTCTGGSSGTFMIEEFRDENGNTGALADPEWNAIMKCMREIYSPYAITVVDTVPAGGQSHNQGIIAGRASNIGFTGVGGIAPATPCAPRDNVISFTFANQYGGTGMARVYDICGTAAQETAHAYGLDHAFKLSTGQPACMDPMTYQPDCGRKFFRNDESRCGEYSERPCQCTPVQNSHRRLLTIFGAGTPITTPPVVALTQPVHGATIGNGYAVGARASAQRGIAHVDLWLNGYMWTSVAGVGWGSSGQPEATYALLIPSGVPDSIIDLVVKAYDDIDVETSTQVITVTKGAPCESASTCAKGQVCEDGKCFWDEPVGEIGDTCEFQQYCKSGMCLSTTDGDVCSRECIVVEGHDCPQGFYCEGPQGGVGYCLAEPSDGGCCSAGGDRRAAMLLSLCVLALVLRKRRR